MNQEQSTAVTQGEGPLLIVAGAGTGKTTVITRRIAWLILSGKCKPDEVLALTFTEKAAGEMEERVDRLLPYGYVNLWISTFHAFCQRILERHGLDIGVPNSFKLLDTTASWLLVRKNLDRFDLDYYRPRGNPTKFIHALLQHFSRAKDEGILPEDYLRYAQDQKRGQSPFLQETVTVPVSAKRSEEIANAYHIYQQLLLENNALDFGDLLVYTRELFMNRPAILEQYRAQFKYILVDEFQDTNWIQYTIVNLLATPDDNLTVMADDDQAIFLWRGASYHNILQFKKDYPQSREIFLTQNYRSCQNILDCAYQFIQHNNPDRLEYQLSEKGGLSKQLRAQHERQGSIEHIHCTTPQEEVALVCKKIAELKEKNVDLCWSDIAILVRANDTAKPFCEHLRDAHIPYYVVSAKGLYTKPVIMDMLAYCTLLVRPHDSPAFWRVLTWPFYTYASATLIALSHYAHRCGISLYEACQKVDAIPDIRPEDRVALKGLCAIIEKHSMLARSARAAEIFLTVVRDSGYLAYLKDGETEEKREGLKVLDVFYKKIRALSLDMNDARLKDILDCVSLEQEAGEQGTMPRRDDESPDAVHILTCHSAKGLEFDHVFIVNMVDRRFPTTERHDAIELPAELLKEIVPQGDAHLEEERRLFYVALTRAKRGVYLTSCEDTGTNRKKKLSRFLHEMGLNVGWGQAQILQSQKLSQTPAEPDPISTEEQKQKFGPDTNFAVLPISHVFSYSQLAAFQKCPLQYKYAFVVKLPVFGKPALSFGRTLHLTLQKFFEQCIELERRDQQQLFKSAENLYTDNHQALPSLDTLFELYDQCWIDEWFSSKRQKEEYRQRGCDILKRLHEEVSRTPMRTKALERDFIIRFGDYPDQITIKGRMDRVDECDDGTVEIIDYKTGTPKDKLTREDKEQLLYYQIASQEVFGEHPSKLTYYYLDDGSTITFIGSDEDIQKLRSKAATIVGQIRESTFEATPGWHCRFCDFRDICEYRAH
ncbi:UvrD-helicase domain-containing protein [Candidatus Uhrbacteria bacterium]|nr:UvrD-helicase domain-containing protein [Candidatus Uhrbacteria bacterium]